MGSIDDLRSRKQAIGLEEAIHNIYRNLSQCLEEIDQGHISKRYSIVFSYIIRYRARYLKTQFSLVIHNNRAQ